MVAWPVIKTRYAKRLQPNKKPALIRFLVLLIVQLLGQTVAFPHYTNSFICCGAPVLKPQTLENHFTPQITQQRQRGTIVRDGDRDTWMKETYGKKEPLGILPFKSFARSHQANAWPKILVSVSLLLQGLFLLADGVTDAMCLGGITVQGLIENFLLCMVPEVSGCTAKGFGVPKEPLSWDSLHSTMLLIFNSASL